MARPKKQGHPGRPPLKDGERLVYEGERRAIMTQWPAEMIESIDRVAGPGNRTRWLIEAAQEKLERERGNP